MGGMLQYKAFINLKQQTERLLNKKKFRYLYIQTVMAEIQYVSWCVNCLRNIIVSLKH